MNKYIRSIAIIIMIWVAISTLIQAFKNPKLTYTELFLKIPNSFICDFGIKEKSDPYWEKNWHEVENINDTSYGFWLFTPIHYSDTLDSTWIKIDVSCLEDTTLMIFSLKDTMYKYFRITVK